MLDGDALSPLAGKGASRGGHVAAAAPDSSKLFRGLETAPAILLAVSGGPDSLALMSLVSRWAAGLAAAPGIHVATVDHGLRPESRAEAEGVARECLKLGLPHVVLTWLGEKPRTRIQERARAARYALLAAHAKRLGATHLLTGHHADDQAETILFRLGRGSGLSGLAGMRRETALAPGLVLTRPLLGLRKAELVAICGAAGLAFVDDPSNHDQSYARPKLRARVDLANALSLDVKTLTRLGVRLARADDALDAEARRRLALLEVHRAPNLFQAGLAPLLDATPEIVVRVLRLAIADVMPHGKAPRLDRLENLAAGLVESLRDKVVFRATLAGARLVLGADGRLSIVPEGSRRATSPGLAEKTRDKPCPWQGE